jgi:hypothetical protein
LAFFYPGRNRRELESGAAAAIACGLRRPAGRRIASDAWRIPNRIGCDSIRTAIPAGKLKKSSRCFRLFRYFRLSRHLYYSLVSNNASATQPVVEIICA